MFDFEIAQYFYKLSKLLSIYFDNTYKTRAYYKAAMAIDAYDTHIMALYEQSQLKAVPGIGTSIEKQISEIIETGKLLALVELENEIGDIDYNFLSLQGVGERLLKKLISKDISSIDKLMNCDVNQLREIGMSMSNIETIFQAKRQYNYCKGKYLLSYGVCLGEEIISYLKNYTNIGNVGFGGQIASCTDKVTQIEILCGINGSIELFKKYVVKNKRLVSIHLEGNFILCQTSFGMPVSISVENKNLNPGKLFTFNELCNDATDNNVILNDIKGDLHNHSEWSDGINTLEQIAHQAKIMGYDYVAITDHSVSLKVANGLSETDVINQIQKIRDLNKDNSIKILASIEVEILANGDLDYSNEVLNEFDFVIAGIHSHFGQSRFEVMERLQRALSNKYVNILAHPTGRLLGKPGVMFSERDGMDIDIDELISICKKYNVALEINCFPERFDLCQENISKALRAGLKLSIDTDSHSISHMNCMKYGVMIAKTAGAEKKDILNTYDYDKLLAYFNNQRGIDRSIISNKPIIKDFDYYFSNNIKIMSGNATVVGIDLTGSESKPSGWAVLSKNKSITMAIKSDDELIEETLKYKPDVVSIDSPLSYPEGRCCSDPNCDCSKYGITRYCERLLMRFSIGVYPCLIPSMANLTTRGMKLAKRFEELGVCAIESYPGVAQDVLKIPRKRRGLEHLIKGLTSFGIAGDLIEKDMITHDEVDAITSALVGYFYLNDQYVALGNEKENFLIIPRVQSDLLSKRVVIGLCGETAAGKTTLAEYFKFKYGFRTKRYSEIIKRINNGEDNKTDLQAIGINIASNTNKQRELSRIIISEMETDKSYIIDGLRQYEDYEELSSNFGQDFMLVYINTKFQNRFNRYKGNIDQSTTEEKFTEINNHKVEQKIPLFLPRANFVIENNSSFKSFFSYADKILKSIE